MIQCHIFWPIIQTLYETITFWGTITTKWDNTCSQQIKCHNRSHNGWFDHIASYLDDTSALQPKSGRFVKYTAILSQLAPRSTVLWQKGTWLKIKIFEKTFIYMHRESKFCSYKICKWKGNTEMMKQNKQNRKILDWFTATYRCKMY